MSLKGDRYTAAIDLIHMQTHARHGHGHKGNVAMRQVVTGEVRVLATGSPELAALRRERDALNGYRALWVQTRLPKRSR